MRRKYLLPLVYFIWFMAPACSSAQVKERSPNLVQDAGFEEQSSPWNLKGGAAVSRTEAHTGTNSLYYSNTDPSKYSLFTQTVDVQPGQKLLFSVWLKGKDITTTNLWAEKG